ncbi:NADP-dependent oxidoreductase domain-containing protein [Aspergillus multicolor]|uniref:NADP-dependent oxidoreductase domain-containing protein n=1 Tax=Aspergillus multicolor TaxID=41759 RepID=UPI003CCC9D79
MILIIQLHIFAKRYMPMLIAPWAVGIFNVVGLMLVGFFVLLMVLLVVTVIVHLRIIKDQTIVKGRVKREELFVTTKLWNVCHAKQRAFKVAAQQVEDWGLGYIDLYLIHFPIALQYNSECTRGWYYDGEKEAKLEMTPIRETWEALEESMRMAPSKTSASRT